MAKWLDNADSWVCSDCGFETNNPNKLKDGPNKCPKCGSTMSVTKNNIWTVVLSSVVDKKIVPSPLNPKISGRYLCTCVRKLYENDPPLRYLQVVYYDAKLKYWHDIAHPHSLSHTVLAWTDDVPLCDFPDDSFKINFGEVFKND